MGTRLVLLFFLFAYFVSVKCVYKRWKPNTNYENPKNWNTGRAPCGSDVVKFPSSATLSPTVFVQTNSTLKELWLPINGEIILGDNSILSFTDTAVNNDDCTDAGGDVEFTRAAKDWTNPDNWCTSATQLGACMTSPMLDSDKIPGLYDDVVFPTHCSFLVSLESDVNYKIKSLKISGSSLSTSSFVTFVNDTEGKRMFPPPQTGAMSTVTVTRSKCKTPRAGCSNGNDQPQMMDLICKFYTDKCNRAKCKTPLQPLGACCQMCGALFNVTIDTGFNITEFTVLLQKFKDGQQPNMDMIVSRMSIEDNLVQVVLQDPTGENSTNLAQTIKKDMDTDLANGGHKYAISAVSLAVSGSASHGPGPGPGPSKRTGGKMGGGSIAGLVITIVVVVPLVIIIAFYMWSRYKNQQNRVTEIVDVARNKIGSLRRRDSDRRPITSMQEMGPIHGQSSFENKMYGAPIDDMNIQDFNLSNQNFQPSFDATGFDNPLYSASSSSKDMPNLYQGSKSKNITL